MKLHTRNKLSRSRLGNLVVLVLLAAMGVFTAIPFLFSIVQSIKPVDELFVYPPRLTVSRPTLDNFAVLFNLTSSTWVPVSRYLFNSLLLTVCGTVGNVVVCSMAAYPLAKLKFHGRKLLFNLVVVSLLFTYEVTFIPNYVILSKLQMLDRMEVYDDSAYQANAMVNALQLGNTTGRGIANRYAKTLLASEEFNNCYYVAAYYYLPLRDFDGFFDACRTGLEQEASNPGAWNSVAHLYAQAGAQLEPEEMEAYLDSVARFAQLLTDFNDSGRMEQIQLSEENQTFLDAAVAQVGTDGQSAYDALQDYFQ